MRRDKIVKRVQNPEGEPYLGEANPGLMWIFFSVYVEGDETS
jgi:hypothetical protein